MASSKKPSQDRCKPRSHGGSDKGALGLGWLLKYGVAGELRHVHPYKTLLSTAYIIDPFKPP